MPTTNAKHPVQDCILSIMLVVIIPLIPLAIEWFMTGDIQTKTIIFVTALYAIDIGIDTKQKVIFGISIVLSSIFFILYGIAFAGNSVANLWLLSLICLIAIIIMGVSDKIIRHGVHKEPFFEFY